MLRTIMMAALCGLVAMPVSAKDRTGLRLESRVAMETPVFSGPPTDGETYSLGNGVTLGFEAGHDWEVLKRVTVGPYVTYEVSDLESCEGRDCVSSRDTISAGLHIAYLRGERSLFYAKAGYSRLSLEAHAHRRDFRDAGSGVQVALGYEHALGDLYARLEAGYGDHGRIFAVDFQRYHSTLALGWRF